MGGGGGSSRPDPVPPPPPPAKIEDKAVQEAKAEALRKKQRGRGYRATIISKNMMAEDTEQKLQTLGS